eukprot:scaffold159958_cov49-Attheya_sp.AAC.1
MESLDARSILIGLIFVLRSSGVDYDVKFGWGCFSDFGWNNIQELRVRRLPPRKYLSSLIDRLIKLLWEYGMMRACRFGGSQGSYSYITAPS